MANIMRGSVQYSGIIETTEESLWKVLVDWGDVSWLDNDHDGPTLARATLEGGITDVPRTRVMHRVDTQETTTPPINRETLFLVDETAHRLYYDASDGFFGGMRNYIATWTIDYVSENSCTMTIQSAFDLDGSMDIAEVKQWLIAVYTMIVRSLNNHFLTH